MSENTSSLSAIIRTVTDQWDEPLDEVHDIPQIANAIIASDWLSTFVKEQVKAEADGLRARAASLADDLDRFEYDLPDYDDMADLRLQARALATPPEEGQ